MNPQNNLPEPIRVLVGQIVQPGQPPMPWEIGQAIDIIRIEIGDAQKRLDEERRRLPGLKKAQREKRARVILTESGTVAEKAAKADLATLSETFDVEVCEQAIQSGREYADVLKTSLSAVQSIGGLLRAEMTALGGFGGGQ